MGAFSSSRASVRPTSRALEDVVDVVEAAGASAAWVDTFRRRYSLSAPPSP